MTDQKKGPFWAMCKIFGVDDALEKCKAFNIPVTPEEEQSARDLELKMAKGLCEFFLKAIEEAK